VVQGGLTRINSQPKYEEDFGLALNKKEPRGNFTPGAIEGSYVVAAEQYRAIIPIHKKGGRS
jgi:hypothetical protein